MIHVIGISGKKLSGKDTLCEFLREHADVKSIRIGFADALKEEVSRACGVSVQFINTNKARFRPILQWWGTDFRRYYKGKDYWVEQALHAVSEACSLGHGLIILPDVRFLSEAKPLKKFGATLYRIARPEQICDEHESETELDDYKGFDEIILNRGTLSDLEHEAIGLLQKLNIPIK